MNIGTVAERSGVPPKTIRYYETIGLIRPADRRPNGYRSYSVADMRTLNFIRHARGLGFSVEEVRDLLDLWRDRKRTSAAVKALATRHLEALDHKIEELETMRKAEADVGIAMGTGTDVAIQSAGVTLVKGDLSGIVRARHLSRRVMRNIRQNLFLAFVYNSLGVPIAAGVLYPFFGLLLSPVIAAAAMSLSSLSVVGNALRLRTARI